MHRRTGSLWTICLILMTLIGLPFITLSGGASAGAVGAPAKPSPGCHASTSVGTGEQTIPFSAAGRSGSYFLEVPSSYSPGRPMPVVFDFHGYAEPAGLQVTISALGTYGESEGFLTVTPGVNEPVPLWESSIGSADLAFFGALLHHVEQTVCVDENRVYVTGYSNGAFMSSAIACQYSRQVAAVAPVAGMEITIGCRPARRVPVVAFHGTADPYVPFNGAPSKVAASLPAANGHGTLGTAAQSAGAAAERSGAVFGLPFQVTAQGVKIGLPIPTVAARWAARNGCASGASTTRVAADVSLVHYRCPDGADVELYVVYGGGHAWPGSSGSAAIAGAVGHTTFSISADVEMWHFFEQHPLSAHD